MVQVSSEFMIAGIRRSLQFLVRTAPWMVGGFALLLLYYMWIPLRHIPLMQLLYFQLGAAFGIAWVALGGWIGAWAVRNKRYERQVLYAIHACLLLQMAYFSVLENASQPGVASFAIACLVIPTSFFMSPLRYRVTMGLLVLGCLGLIKLNMDEPVRYSSLCGQFVGLAVLSAALQRKLFVKHLRIFDYISRLNEHNQRLEKTVAQDHLTQLANRRTFEDRFQQEWQRARRHPHAFALLSMDLDHFKAINDTQGHPFGDQVLREVGELLGYMARRSDLAARVGGEEFMLLLVETDREGALAFAERLRMAVPGIPATAQYGKPITASFGLVVSHEVESSEEMLHQADRRLYQAKHQGRNRVVAED